MTGGEMDQITNDDIATLVDALEAWENKDFAGEMMGELVGAMFAKSDPVAKAKIEAERCEQQLKRERAKVTRKEQSVILRAKLLTIRNSRIAADAKRMVAEYVGTES